MRSLLASIALFVAVATFAAGESRPVSIRGWTFDVPAFLSQDIHEGPDFTVTYLTSKERKMALGIYEGWAPQEFAAERSGVTHEKSRVCEQEATWALWEEVTDGAKSYHAETFVLIDPASKEPEKFHIFVLAASPAEVDLLRAVVRSARRHKANHTAEPASPSRGGSP